MLTQCCCKGENTSYPCSSWAPGAGITDTHTSYTTRQCLLIKDYKWATFQHLDQTLTCCSKPFSKPKESKIDNMELWKGKIVTSCKKQKNCWWDVWEKIHIHSLVSLSSFKEEQCEQKWEVKHHTQVLDPNRNQGSSVCRKGEKENHVFREYLMNKQFLSYSWLCESTAPIILVTKG